MCLLHSAVSSQIRAPRRPRALTACPAQSAVRAACPANSRGLSQCKMLKRPAAARAFPKIGENTLGKLKELRDAGERRPCICKGLVMGHDTYKMHYNTAVAEPRNVAAATLERFNSLKADGKRQRYICKELRMSQHTYTRYYKESSVGEAKDRARKTKVQTIASSIDAHIQARRYDGPLAKIARQHHVSTCAIARAFAKNAGKSSTRRKCYCKARAVERTQTL